MDQGCTAGQPWDCGMRNKSFYKADRHWNCQPSKEHVKWQIIIFDYLLKYGLVSSLLKWVFLLHLIPFLSQPLMSGGIFGGKRKMSRGPWNDSQRPSGKSRLSLPWVRWRAVSGGERSFSFLMATTAVGLNFPRKFFILFLIPKNLKDPKNSGSAVIFTHSSLSSD